MAIIIAEMCQNHGGDRELLKRMIGAAVAAGADYAKIQTIHSDDLTHRPRFDTGQVENGVTTVIKRPYRAEYERLKAMDITFADHQWFIDTCRGEGIAPLTTVFTRGSIPRLAAMDWPAIKVASYDCASLTLLEELTRHFATLFVSTGATYDEEIEKAARILAGRDATLLHCVTVYPTPLDMMNLRRMACLRRFCPKVGFSDHSLVARDGILAAVTALHLGADVIERHFTILDADQTKDGPVSIGPDHLRELCTLAKAEREVVADWVKRHVPDVAALLGSETRPLTHEELLNRDYYRGRFATKTRDGGVVYNWETAPVS